MGVDSSFAIFPFFSVENAFERMICLVACLMNLCRLLSMLKRTGQSDFYGIIINIFVLSLLKSFPFRGCVEMSLSCSRIITKALSILHNPTRLHILLSFTLTSTHESSTNSLKSAWLLECKMVRIFKDLSVWVSLNQCFQTSSINS